MSLKGLGNGRMPVARGECPSMDCVSVATMRISEVEKKCMEEAKVEGHESRQPEESTNGVSDVIRGHGDFQKTSRKREAECDIWGVSQEDTVNRAAEQEPSFKG